MWNGKNKAITFSFDDGAFQDIKVVEILNKYGLKATFNLNSAYLGTLGSCEYNGHTVSRDKVSAHRVREIYKNHEVAAHTIAHPDLTKLSEDDIAYQVEADRKLLSELCGYEVRGMAYPGGGVNHNDFVVDVVKRRTHIEYARVYDSSYNFDLQPDNLLRFKPTVYYLEADKMFSLAEQFLALKADKPQLFYIWGHTYELDFGDDITWERFEEFCKLVSHHDDIFYGTNAEVLLNR